MQRARETSHVAAAEGHAREYGAEAARTGATLSDTVQRFLRFGRRFVDELAVVARRRHLDTREATELLADADSALDRVPHRTDAGPQDGSASMNQPWALTASAAEMDAASRDRLANEVDQWLEAGHDGVAVTTCHRVELYGIGASPALHAPRIRLGRAAVAHLMRVAAGLESAIVGEDEVLHQVRDALRRAERGGQVDCRLRRMFESAIATGRRARSRRTESSGNLAQSAVAWLQSRSDLSGRAVIVAGAGRMGSALAHALADAGALITVASRDQARASRLAGVYSGRGVDLEAAAALTGEAAAVAVALGGPWHDLAAARPDADLPPIADISAPPAVPDSVRSRLNGSFLGIDDLFRRSQSLPGAYIKDAEALVERNTAEYIAWLGRAR